MNVSFNKGDKVITVHGKMICTNPDFEGMAWFVREENAGQTKVPIDFAICIKTSDEVQRTDDSMCVGDGVSFIEGTDGKCMWVHCE